MPSHHSTSSPLSPPDGGDGDRPITLAAIIGAHGVTGEVRLKLFTDDLKPYRAFNGGALTLKSVRVGPKGAIARFAEIPDRTAAEKLRGTALTVLRAELPPLGEGEYYHVDLVGLPVVTDAGTPAGRVVAVENFGAGDLIDVEDAAGRRVLVPVAVAEIGATAIVPAAFLE
ncbi:ribosome maturation factor RimM [Hephaestia sp. GCM10023244]|uniref:ribosome maturation factor RimM n=1 Tax=unclassified Hephaestia TaxID=2631281 RepID=UPI0020772C15|nr:ribosome maturation factor RimM [Hephaestia sp. MAHUQ-44]MCM8730128.1 ribosome maturation factor RimM [Hephaestia sp. MAHUQ-44]